MNNFYKMTEKDFIRTLKNKSSENFTYHKIPIEKVTEYIANQNKELTVKQIYDIIRTLGDQLEDALVDLLVMGEQNKNQKIL